MKKSRTAQLSSDLLVSKGAAGPSHANQENLGPDRIEQALREARAHAGSARAPGPDEPEPAHDGPISLSVQLDRERHRQLERATICVGGTVQSIVIEALDAYMAKIAGEPTPLGRGTAVVDQIDESDQAGALVEGATTALD